MIKSTFTKLLFIPLLLGLTSCFQIIEEINLNPDGTGEVTLTLNLSQSKTKLASIMLLDSIRGHNVPNEEEIQASLNKAVAYLKKSAGISNVKKSLDLDNYIASIRFSFQDISNINHLSETILKDNKVKFSNPSNYSFFPAKGLFLRKYQSVKTGGEEFAKLSQEDQDIFKQATYTNIFRFDRNIAFYTNRRAQVSPSNKALMLQCSVQDLVNGTVNISNQITLATSP